MNFRSVRFFVFQSKDMATLPELQAGYSLSYLIDELGFSRTEFKVQSVYPFAKHYQKVLDEIPNYQEETFVFFLENFYHSSMYALKEVQFLLPLIKNKKVIIHSLKISEDDAKAILEENENVCLVVRTDLEYFLKEHLGNNVPFSNIPNLVFRDNKLVLSSPPENVSYPLDYIFPAYTNGKLLEDKDNTSFIASVVDEDDENTDDLLAYRKSKKKYIESLYREEYLKTAMVCTGRGCKYRCAYCYRGAKFSSVRQIPLPIVEFDLAYLKDLGYRRIYFYDDCFLTTNFDRLESVLEMMRKYDFEYYIAVRYEMCSSEILTRLEGIKFYFLQIGLQTTKNAKHHKRNVDQDRFSNVVDRLKRNGSFVSIDLILGLPGETKDDFLETLRYAISLNPNNITVNTLFINPGTELVKTYKDFGIKVKTVQLNVPFIVESSTFSKSDMDECREVLKKCSKDIQNISFTIR